MKGKINSNSNRKSMIMSKSKSLRVREVGIVKTVALNWSPNR